MSRIMLLLYEEEFTLKYSCKKIKNKNPDDYMAGISSSNPNVFP